MLRLLVALGFGFGICVEFGLWVGLTDYARFGDDVATSSRFPSAHSHHGFVGVLNRVHGFRGLLRLWPKASKKSL